MLLKELKGVKSLKNKLAYDILDNLKKEHGVKVVNGSFGVVMMHDSWDYVIKFFAKDDCYLDFVKFCAENKSKHLPNFKRKPKSIKTFFDTEAELDSFYAVRIEKLAEMPIKLYREVIFPMIGLNFIAGYSDVIGTSKEDAFLERKKLLEYKELANVIFDLHEQKPGGCNLDLHDANFMMRGKDIVVVDPFSSFDDEKVTPINMVMSAIDNLVTRPEDDEFVHRISGSLAMKFSRF